MKRFAMVLVLIFIFGVSCGGIYQLTLGSGELIVPAFITDSIEKFEDKQAEKKAEKEEQLRREKEIIEKIKAEKENSEGGKEEKEPLSDSEPESTSPDQKSGKITNPQKTCSTEGCDRAVFVEYNGVELCVKCYAEAKKQTAKN